MISAQFHAFNLNLMWKQSVGRDCLVVKSSLLYHYGRCSFNHADVRLTPFLRSALIDCSKVPPVWTKSSTITTCRPCASPSFIRTFRVSPSRFWGLRSEFLGVWQCIFGVCACVVEFVGLVQVCWSFSVTSLTFSISSVLSS